MLITTNRKFKIQNPPTGQPSGPKSPVPKEGKIQKWLTTQVLPIENWPMQRWHGSQATTTTDRVVIEEPFEIRLNGRSLAAIMRTPGVDSQNDRELAVGFLLSEGVISDPGQVLSIGRVKDDDGLPLENVLDVRLAAQVSQDAAADEADSKPETGQFERRFVVASSCGLCGKNSIAEVCRRLPSLGPETFEFKVPVQTLYSLPPALRTAQAIFEETGGLHAAGLFDQQGQLLLLREDIGRHNAVDKIIGRMALDGAYPLEERILLVSGRTSFEIVQKALAARIPIVAAVSAPSSLALELAQEGGITLIGFLREAKMNVYTHPSRVG